MKLSIALTLLMTSAVEVAAQSDKQEHYLVGLLNYPNSFVPDVLKNHTSGTYITMPYENLPSLPLSDVPGVGFSDMEFYYDENGDKVLGQFYCLSDNGTFCILMTTLDLPFHAIHFANSSPITLSARFRIFR